MASDLLLIVDDNSDEFRYSSPEWQLSDLVQWYGGTSRSASFRTGATQLGSFSVNFEGKSIAFYGMTPAAVASQAISISIDGGAPYIASYGDSNPPSYRQWYQSPDLADGVHNITVGQIDGATLDFAVLTPYPNTPINRHRAIVDDDNFAIRYSGAWRRNLNKIDAGNLPDGSPFHNGTHQSWNPGDSLSFSFTGSSVAVYGVFSWGNLGLLSATYTLDGVSQSQSYPVTSSSPEFVNKIGQASNFLYYSSDSVSSGSHTLIINITHCTNQSFILDYITYVPSFTRLSRMPNYTTTTTTTEQKSSITPTGAGRTYNPLTASAGDETNSQKIRIAPIIGGIAGGLIFFALVGLFICCLRKRHMKKTRKRIGSDLYADPSRPLMQSSLTHSQRNTATRPISVNSHRSVSPLQYHIPADPVRPDSAVGLKRSRQDQQRRARQPSRSQIPDIRTQSPSRGQERRSSSLERPRGSFESYGHPHREQRSTPIRNHCADSPSTSSLLSPHFFVRPSRQSDLGPASTTRGPNSDNLDAQRVRQSTLPARDRIKVQAEPTSALSQEGRARSTSDNSRNGNSLHHGSRTPARLTPVRRGLSDSPTLSGTVSTSQGVNSPAPSSALATVVARGHSTAENDRQNWVRPFTPVRATPRSTSHLTTEHTNASRGSVFINTRAHTNPVQPSARPLTPVRRNVTDPPSTAPVQISTRSPIAAAFPRLSAILLRHSRSVLLDVPSDVNEDDENWDGELAPPAYDSLPPRRLRSTASNIPASRPLPSLPAS